MSIGVRSMKERARDDEDAIVVRQGDHDGEMRVNVLSLHKQHMHQHDSIPS